jgi:hypothetical protein
VHSLPVFFVKWKPLWGKKKSCKPSELIPSFMKQYPISLIFQLGTLKLGVKQGLQGQTRTQRQGDFMDKSIVDKSVKKSEL